MSSGAAPITWADDMLLHQLARPFGVVAEDSRSWFDRFYFSLHPPGAGPMLVVGVGVYANADVADGYACLTSGASQRNIRSSRPLSGEVAPTRVGCVAWEVLEPLRRWRLVVDGSAEGFSADVVYTSRTAPYAVEPIAVAHGEGPQTEFAHFFQPGRYDGRLEIDGQTHDVEGWFGLRDRSWGVRRTRERLGMHLWGGAQFEDGSLLVHYNEDRTGRPQHVDGAYLPIDGDPVPAAAVRHAFEIDAGLELVAGKLEVTLEGGETIALGVSSLGPGLYMAGAGYGGWHGQPRGHHVEHERWPLDGSITPRDLSIGLVDKLCTFTDGQRTGPGVLELALSRSSEYRYAPTLDRND